VTQVRGQPSGATFSQPITLNTSSDGGSGGTNTFRADAGCWGTYVPAVQFKASKT